MSKLPFHQPGVAAINLPYFFYLVATGLNQPSAMASARGYANIIIR